MQALILDYPVAFVNPQAASPGAEWGDQDAELVKRPGFELSLTLIIHM